MALLNKIFLLALILSAPLAQANSIPAKLLDSATQLNGAPFKPQTQKVLLYFWATWCPSCKQKLEAEFPKVQLPANVALVTVNTDKEADRASHFVEKEGMKLTVIRDQDKALTNALKLFAVPAWAVLSREKDKSWKVLDSGTGGEMSKILEAARK